MPIQLNNYPFLAVGITPFGECTRLFTISERVILQCGLFAVKSNVATFETAEIFLDLYSIIYLENPVLAIP